MIFHGRTQGFIAIFMGGRRTSLLNWVVTGVLISNLTVIITIMTFPIIIMIGIVDYTNIMLCAIIIT